MCLAFRVVILLMASSISIWCFRNFSTHNEDAAEKAAAVADTDNVRSCNGVIKILGLNYEMLELKSENLDIFLVLDSTRS